MDIKNLLFPTRKDCLFCGGIRKESEFICDCCKERLEYRKGERKIEGHTVNFFLKYNAFFREQLHKYKFGGNTYLGKVFAEFFIEEIQDFGIKADLIINTPQDNLTEALRGFCPMEIIAREISKNTGIEYCPNLIFKTGKTERQSASKYEDRFINLEGVFKLNEFGFAGKRILVIDDIVTTGSTLKEIFKVLEKGKPADIFGLTLTEA